MDLADGVVAGVDETRQDVVGVGGQHQLGDRQPHAPGDVAGENVAEIAGRHREVDLVGPGLLAHLAPGVEVVDDLGEHPRPVDGVDRTEGVALLEVEVAEDLLDDLLAVVEGALDGQVEDVGIGDRGHLQLLHRRDLLVRVQDEDVDVLLAAHPVDGGAAGVAGGGAEDVHVLARFGQQVLEQVAEELQGDVLEGEGRAVEELQDEHAVPVHDRGDLRVGEARRRPGRSSP